MQVPSQASLLHEAAGVSGKRLSTPCFEVNNGATPAEKPSTRSSSKKKENTENRHPNIMKSRSFSLKLAIPQATTEKHEDLCGQTCTFSSINCVGEALTLQNAEQLTFRGSRE